MKKNIWLLGFVAVSLCGFLLSPGYAQTGSLEMISPENWQEIVGTVEDIDLDSAMMVVKAYSDEKKASYQEVTISITKEAKIIKNEQELALKDLQAGDEISVRYILTANGQKAAYAIWVK